MKKELLTRRSAVRAAAGIGGALGLGTRKASAIHAISETKATAFALIGDESHNSDYIRSALTSTLVHDAGLSIDFTDAGRRSSVIRSSSERGTRL